MTRSAGFAVMDVSTSIADDPKFRRLQRQHPEHLALAFMVYIATLGESWKAGRRVSVVDAWPVLLAFDAAIVDTMMSVGLIDSRGLPPAKAWAGWFGPANERRTMARERWARANKNRNADAARSDDDAAPSPRGSSAVTEAIPSVRSSPSVPTGPSVPSTRNGAPENAQEARPTKRGGPMESAKAVLDRYGYTPPTTSERRS